jgi:hypothetical protein
MEKARVMDTPEDYKKIGVVPGKIQQWEDGRRLGSEAGSMENWYFDAIVNGNTKVVICFRPRSPRGIAEPGDAPNINIHITLDDGTTYNDFINVPSKDCVMAKDKCDVHFGPHSFVGDLTDYDIHVEPVNGIGADLHFHCLVEPFRPATGYLAFGDDESKHYTWTCFPKGEVMGTLTFDGKTIEVNGIGYHDHQWHDTNPIALMHHWLWGRMSSSDYTVAIFDLVANKHYGYKEMILFAVMDPSGKIVFQSAGDASSQVLEDYFEPTTKKRYPKKIRYSFQQGAKKATFTITWTKELEIRGTEAIFIEKSEEAEKKFAAMGLDPSYIRYQAHAELKLDEGNGSAVESDGEMIYEFPYFGKADPAAHLEVVK